MSHNKVTKWIAPCLTAVLLFALAAWLQNLFSQETLQGTVRALADCFTAPGVILCGIALLGWIGTFGQFDMLSYGTLTLLGHFLYPIRKDLPSHFHEYRKERDEKGRKWNKTFLWVGLICLAAAIAATVWFSFL